MNNNDLIIDDDMFLKVIFNLCKNNDSYTRISDVSSALGMRPSKINYIINKLCLRGYIVKKEFGLIQITTEGIRRCGFLNQDK